MQLGEVFVALGFDVDDKKLKEFDDGIKSLSADIFKLTAGAAAAVYAINRFVASSVDSSVKLKNFREQTGYASEEVERFYNVAGRLNTEVTLDQTISAFRSLADTIANAKLGVGAIGEAAQLGLYNIGNMTPMEVIKQLRKNFKENVAAWGQGDEVVIGNLMKAIGLPIEMLQAIKASDSDFDSLWSKAIPEAAQRQELEKLALAVKEFSMQWENLKVKTSAALSPSLIAGLEAVLPKVIQITNLVSDLASGFGKLDGTLQTGILATIPLIVTALRPLLLLLYSLNFALDQYKKLSDAGGKDGARGGLEKNALGFAAMLMKSEEGSTMANKKREWADKYFPDEKYSDEELGIIPQGMKGSAMAMPTTPGGASKVSNTTINQTNNFEINSSADAEDVGAEFQKVLQRTLNGTEIDLSPNAAGRAR